MIALLRRDLLLALRAGGGFGLGLAFFLIVTVLVPFSVGPQSDLLTIIAPGVLWLGALHCQRPRPLVSPAANCQSRLTSVTAQPASSMQLAPGPVRMGP